MAGVAAKNLTHAMLRPDGLLDRAAAVLGRTVASDPDNMAALRRLGDIYRGLGKLREALDCYTRVVAAHPDDAKAARLAAILGRRALPETAEASPAEQPVPFVRMTDFLPEQQCQALLDLALASRERFQPALVIVPPEGDAADGSPAVFEKGIVDPCRRKGLVAGGGVTEREVQPWLEARLRDAFALALPRLQMREPSAYSVEMAMSAYVGSGFFGRHRDNSAPAFRTRKVSFAYYFHAQPPRFCGGDLLLHDGDGSQAFTRVEPQHNSIVLFPASSLHEVAPIVSNSANFPAARFAIHGWLHSAACIV